LFINKCSLIAVRLKIKKPFLKFKNGFFLLLLKMSISDRRAKHSPRRLCHRLVSRFEKYFYRPWEKMKKLKN